MASLIDSEDPDKPSKVPLLEVLTVEVRLYRVTDKDLWPVSDEFAPRPNWVAQRVYTTDAVEYTQEIYLELMDCSCEEDDCAHFLSAFTADGNRFAQTDATILDDPFRLSEVLTMFFDHVYSTNPKGDE